MTHHFFRQNQVFKAKERKHGRQVCCTSRFLVYWLRWPLLVSRDSALSSAFGSPETGLRLDSNAVKIKRRFHIKVFCGMTNIRYIRYDVNSNGYQIVSHGYGSKLGTPKLWMVNTKLDIHICGPTSVFHFDPHPHHILWNDKY